MKRWWVWNSVDEHWQNGWYAPSSYCLGDRMIHDTPGSTQWYGSTPSNWHGCLFQSKEEALTWLHQGTGIDNRGWTPNHSMLRKQEHNPCKDIFTTNTEKEQSQMYTLYSVAAHNPNTGDVVLEPTTVTAKNEQSARNKAIAKIAENAGDANLDELLDDVTVVVRPF